MTRRLDEFELLLRLRVDGEERSYVLCGATAPYEDPLDALYQVTRVLRDVHPDDVALVLTRFRGGVP